MTASIIRPTQQGYEITATSTGGYFSHRTRSKVVAIPIHPRLFEETTALDLDPEQDLILMADRTTSGGGTLLPDPLRAQEENTDLFKDIQEETHQAQPTSSQIRDLKHLMGLPWDKIADLFGVSRRTPHYWVSGKPLESSHERRLGQLLSVMQFIDRGSSNLNRSLLLSPAKNGEIPFELLLNGHVEKVKELLGPGNASPRPKLKPLSKEAQEARKPPRPEDLVDALQDPIHHDFGRSRSVKAARVLKHEQPE